MKIFLTSSVFILEKSYLYQNGVEFHQESNGIGGATVAPRGATGGATVAPLFHLACRPYNRVRTRWSHQILVWSVAQTKILYLNIDKPKIRIVSAFMQLNNIFGCDTVTALWSVAWISSVQCALVKPVFTAHCHSQWVNLTIVFRLLWRQKRQSEV